MLAVGGVPVATEDEYDAALTSAGAEFDVHFQTADINVAAGEGAELAAWRAGVLSHALRRAAARPVPQRRCRCGSALRPADGSARCASGAVWCCGAAVWFPACRVVRCATCALPAADRTLGAAARHIVAAWATDLGGVFRTHPSTRPPPEHTDAWLRAHLCDAGVALHFVHGLLGLDSADGPLRYTGAGFPRRWRRGGAEAPGWLCVASCRGRDAAQLAAAACDAAGALRGTALLHPSTRRRALTRLAVLRDACAKRA